MIGRRDEIPRLQSDFYRDKYYMALSWLFGSIMIILLLILTMVYLLLFSASPDYYASTTTGQIIKLTPLYQQ